MKTPEDFAAGLVVHLAAVAIAHVSPEHGTYTDAMKVVIRDAIAEDRAEVVERCAKVAEEIAARRRADFLEHGHLSDGHYANGAAAAAAAIRALAGS